MEIVVSYPNVLDLQRTLLKNYPFKSVDHWSGGHIDFPESIGEGSLNLFEHNGLQFMRSSWKFKEQTTFRSPDPVGASNLIDFRISKSGEVRSAYLEGCRKYEWDISRIDGMRLMVPAKLFSEKRSAMLDKFQRYTFESDIQRVIKDLFHTQVKGYMDCVKMEWKFLELSYCWLDFLNKKDIAGHFFDLSERSIGAIKDAATIITSDLMNPPSIKSLSKMVGLNQQYLKAGFKKINGLTIHQFLMRQRMQVARDLVRQQMPICEVARSVGYNHAGHFAKVYRRFYGINPLKDKR